MNPRRITITAFATAFGAILSLGAQERNYLPLEDALKKAEANNKNIRMAAFETQEAKANFRQTDAAFLPSLSVSYQAMTTNNPLNAFGFLLQQREVTAQHFTPESMNHPGATQNYGASADLSLPLFNPELIYARKGAKLQKEAYGHREAYTRNYIRYEVQKAYTQLQFAYEAREVLQASLNDVKDIHRSVQHFHEEGLVQKSDVLNAQVQVNTIESALQKAESNIINASEGLRLLLNEEETLSTPFLTDSLVQQHGNVVARSFSPIRSDILAMQSAVEASHAGVKSAAMNFLPKINAFGSYQFNDSKIFGFKEDSYLAGISLSWTLFSGNQNRSKWRAATFKRNKMQLELEAYKDKSRIEVDKNARDLKDLQTEIDMHTLSVEQATEALRILNNRHREGLVSTTDLLMQQAQLSKQQLARAQAIMNYNITYYYHELLTITQ